MQTQLGFGLWLGAAATCQPLVLRMSLIPTLRAQSPPTAFDGPMRRSLVSYNHSSLQLSKAVPVFDLSNPNLNSCWIQSDRPFCARIRIRIRESSFDADSLAKPEVLIGK